jgi:hypothetical protein
LILWSFRAVNQTVHSNRFNLLLQQLVEQDHYNKMRHFYTATLERHTKFSGTFATEPFEAGWALEAIFFVRIETLTGLGGELGEAGSVDAKVQISADGIHWIDEGTAFKTQHSCGDYFIRCNHFGGWLRLLGNVNGHTELTIHLVLKE